MFIATGKDRGDLRISFDMPQGNTVLMADAPQTTGGKNEYFCPTDLVANALGGCVMMTLAIAGKGHGIDVADMSMEIEKEMSEDAPRRIKKIGVRVFFAQAVSPKGQETLQRAAMTCPVKNSLHPDMEKVIELIFPA